MAGFFDRLKERFTQNAAGTTDLSHLSEEQQKLLRRQFIGRLGTSLAQTGDFGAGMEAQAKIAAEQRAQMQAQAEQQRLSQIWNGPSGAAQGAPLNASQAQIVDPQTPELLRAPQRAPSVQPLPGQGAGAGPSISPQQAVAAVQDAASKRAYYENVARQLMAEGRREDAQAAMEMAKEFAAREEYFTPMAARINGQEVLIQGSKSGGMNVLPAAPNYTDTVRTQEQFAGRPDLYAQWLAGKEAGATRVDARQVGPDAVRVKMFEMDADRVRGMKEQLDSSLRLLPGLEMAFEAANRNDTGALEAALLPIQRYLNPDAQAVVDAPLLAAGVINSVLNKLGLVGGSDTEREMLELKATEPNWANNPETNRRMFALALRAMRELAEDVRSAENTLYDQGTLRNWRPTTYRGLDDLLRRVNAPAGPQDAAGARPGSIASRYGLE